MIGVSAYSDIAMIMQKSASVLVRFRGLECPHQDDPEFLEKMNQGAAVLNLLQEGWKKFSDPAATISAIDLDHIRMLEIARPWMIKNPRGAASAHDVLQRMLKRTSRDNLSTQELESAIGTLRAIAALYRS